MSRVEHKPNCVLLLDTGNPDSAAIIGAKGYFCSCGAEPVCSCGQGNETYGLHHDTHCDMHMTEEEYMKGPQQDA